MINLTTQSEFLVELSEDQQEVVSGGGGKCGYHPTKHYYHKKHGYKHGYKKRHYGKKW